MKLRAQRYLKVSNLHYHKLTRGQNQLINYFQASSNSYGGDKSDVPKKKKETKQKEELDSKLVQHCVIDRSFTDLGYIGYGDGIDL